ncbi:TadE/TadG family type IV pilus assembly protein [Roseateles sp. DC23W]|uniref:TadE/TadG family type IV pilus assembly protein n=1 Tax=Pelomonas dachongensis TaxID=3299029 RepID=A0ABW7EH41_9BURK
MKSCHRQRGATLMEFVIVFPLAALLVMGLIQAGFIYMAKLTLNHATFMAARVGATHNASKSEMRTALLRGLIPFVQNSFETNDSKRLLVASGVVLGELPFTTLELLNPSAKSFADFGVKDSKVKATYIPNDNLEWRANTLGKQSQQNLRDANLLKIRVVYGYELKVPLMAGIMRRVMCSGESGVEAWGNVSIFQSVYPLANKNCAYYLLGRMPIESTAIVEMQSPAYQ